MNKTSASAPSATKSKKTPAAKPASSATTKTKPTTTTTAKAPVVTKKPFVSAKKPATPSKQSKPNSAVLIPKEKGPVPKETAIARANRTQHLILKMRRELKYGIGANDNANLGGTADSSGYSPYVLE